MLLLYFIIIIEYVICYSRAILHNPDVVGAAPQLSSLLPPYSLWTNDFWGAPLHRRGSHGSWRPLTTYTFR